MSGFATEHYVAMAALHAEVVRALNVDLNNAHVEIERLKKENDELQSRVTEK